MYTNTNVPVNHSSDSALTIAPSLKEKHIVSEIFYIRCIACLSVVLLHALDKTLSHTSITDLSSYYLNVIRMLFMFATPVFVLISEFVISLSYSRNVPPDFLRKRIALILFPFIFMGFVYAGQEAWLNNLSILELLKEFFKNIFLGAYHGYFILIIFQFYLLHLFFHKFLARSNPFLILFFSFVINFLYLAVFNFISPPDFIPFSVYLWEKFSWIPFTGWLFYFTLAYYCGSNYTIFRKFLSKYKVGILILPLVSGSLVVLLYLNGIISTPYSKRVDILLYASSIFFMLFYIASKLKKVTPLVKFISNYSFSIYLLHPFFATLVEGLIPNKYPIFTFTATLLFSLLLSIIISNLLNRTGFGKYLVGFSPIKNIKKQEKSFVEAKK